MKRLQTPALFLLFSSLFSSAAFSATPDYQYVNLSIVPDRGTGYAHTFYVPNDNKTHYFYFSKNDPSMKETTISHDFDVNTDSNSTYFTFKQTRNANVPNKDNFYFNIYYVDYGNNNCLASSNSKTIFFQTPSINFTVPKSNCGESKITYTVSATLN